MNKNNNTLMDNHFPKGDTFEINRHPLYWVATLNSTYVQAMEKRLKPIGLDITRWRVAMILKAHGSLNISQISKLAVSRLPTTTKIIQRMEKENLIRSIPDENDGRVNVISLTSYGHEVLIESLERTQRFFSHLFENVTEDEIKTVNRILRKLVDNIVE